MNLKDFPRPVNDNGISIHFRLDVRETDNKPNVSDGVKWLQQIHAKWTLVAAQDWDQCAKAGALIAAAGIMPVFRLICKIDGQHDFVAGMAKLKAAGFPNPYVQIFNEPGDGREWNKKPDIGKFGGAWASNAIQVFDAGGYPGVGAVLGQDEWLAAFNALQASGRKDVWQRAWFCVHNYGSNHPVDYPYDDVNQRGTPVSQAEYAALQFSLPIDQVNALRASSARPGATIMTDDTAMLRFLEFKAWMDASLGFCLPMIGGEGGWEWGNEEDHRYSKLTPGQHAIYTTGMFNQFRTGRLTNGDPLPDELFSIAPWIMADWGADDWWYGALDTKQGTIDAVASIPTFVRQFGGTPPPHECPTGQHWDDALQQCVDDLPPPPPPPSIYSVVPPNSPARPQDWFPVVNGSDYKVTQVIFFDVLPATDPAAEGDMDLMLMTKVVDKNGFALNGVPVIQSWPSGASTHYTRDGVTRHLMGPDGYFDPEKGKGPYKIMVGDASVNNLGYPLKQHIGVFIQVVRQA